MCDWTSALICDPPGLTNYDRKRSEPLIRPPPPTTPPQAPSTGSKSIGGDSALSPQSIFLRQQTQEWSPRRSSSLIRTRSEGASSAKNRFSQYKAQLKHVAGLPMESARPTAHSISSSSAYSAGSREDVHSIATTTSTLFVHRHGRKYLRNVPYPLPVDLPELHRQNLETLLATTVFGSAVGSPLTEKHPPRTVLEIGCGGGFWSAQCADYLAQLGCLNVSFTGIDIAPLAPDFHTQGINWRFVQHDIRKVPLPFEDESFDLIVLKDLSMVLQIGQPTQRILDEAIRMLHTGGVLEIWEIDRIIRSLSPHPPPPPGKNAEEHRQALLTGTFLISAATPFGPARNNFLQGCNVWIQNAFDKRNLSPVPCAGMLALLLQETEDLCDAGGRRVAIPFGEMLWEQSDAMLIAGREFEVTRAGFEWPGTGLTQEQASVRSTALQILVQFIESMEPLLKEVSGKNDEEWQRFWSMMMSDLFEEEGSKDGDCLEIGVYWARKR